jgi:hypothetical protein
MLKRRTVTINIVMIRWTIAGYVLLGFAAAYNAYATLSTDPNQTQFNPDSAFEQAASRPDPNISLVELLPSVADPNAAAVVKTNVITGTLALNWLYQGKTPPAPLVGQEKVSFRTEVHPWPYYDYDRNRPFASSSAAPWIHHPRDESDYWKAAGKDFTYPLNYAEVQMKLNAQTTLNLGVYFLSDPISKP